MTKMKRYLIGTGIIALLISIAFYSVNNKRDNLEVKTTESNPVTQDIEAKSENVEGTKETEIKVFSTTDEENSKIIKPGLSDKYDKILSEVKVLVEKYYDVSKELDQNTLMSSNAKDIKNSKDYNNKKKEIVEKYENIKNYIIPGLSEDSYIVFTTYEIKLRSIDTLVPGMSVLTITNNDSGDLVIDVAPNDEKVNNYIKQLSNEPEMKAIIKVVNSKLKNAVKKDASLKQFINNLKDPS